MAPTDSGDLLLDWLALPSEAREAFLAQHAGDLTPERVRDWLALAESGPSYGQDRQAEHTFQLSLLELAIAAADAIALPTESARARRLLARSLGLEPGHVRVRLALLGEAIRRADAGQDVQEAFSAALERARLHAAEGHPREALEAYGWALDRALGAPALDDAVEELIEAICRLAIETAAFESALAPLRSWLSQRRARADRRGAARAAYLLGKHLNALGRVSDAREVLEEAGALAGEVGDDETLALADLQLMVACYTQGDMPAAGRYFDALLALRPRLSDPTVLQEIAEHLG